MTDGFQRKFRSGFVLVGAVMLTVLLVSYVNAGPSTKLPGTTTYTSNSSGDDYEQLPKSLRGYSQSTLIMLGLLHPAGLPQVQLPKSLNPSSSTLGSVGWLAPSNISQYPDPNPHPTPPIFEFGGSNEPGVALHPTNWNKSLAGGNSNSVEVEHTVRIERNTDLSRNGLWSGQQAPNCPSSSGDGMPIWTDSNTNSTTALFMSICARPNAGVDTYLSVSKSTNSGAAWFPITSTNLNDGRYVTDREYLWADYSSSLYRGRIYVTSARFPHDVATPPAPTATPYNAVGVQYTTDQGATWSNFAPLTNDTSGTNVHQHASLAVQPSGNLVAIWCRFGGDRIDTIMWARSTDGGQSFSEDHVLHEVPLLQSIGPNDKSPGGFRWSPIPNIAADPVKDGILYAVWAAYRDPSRPNPNPTPHGLSPTPTPDNTSAGIYFSKGTTGTDGNISWSDPKVIYNGDLHKYQYFPWIQVSKDRVIHVTFGARPEDSSSERVVNAYYVQSNNGGDTFTQPFALRQYPFLTSGFMGDYQSTNVGGYAVAPTPAQGHVEGILTSWTETQDGTGATENRWGSFGTFCSNVFNDVDLALTSPFYSYSRLLSCKGIMGGYPCGGPTEPCEYGNNSYFRPSASITRGQIAKIVAVSAGYNDPAGSQIYEDVPPDSTFYGYINNLTRRGVMGGYPCSSDCIPPNYRPYFRPNNSATRGQIAKIVANAKMYPGGPSTQMFEDVP